MQLNRDDLKKAYTGMQLIREFEDAVHIEFASGILPGFVHLYAGEESSAMGVCMNLNDQDTIASTHRGHGHCIAKGCDAKAMMKELFGKKDGICGGKGGSMHIADLTKGMLGANGIVGGGPPLVCGSALTFKTKKTGNVSVCFLGDGASNQGTTAESMNLASILKLPAIFVVEDNGYAEATSSKYSVGGNIVDRGKAYGLHAEKVDGSDFFAVYQAAKEAVERAKNNEGPTLLHVKINRIYGHYEGDALTYRLGEETEDIKKNKDPIKIFKKKVIESGLLDIKELKDIENEVKKEIEEAVKEAKNSSYPTEADLLTDVYVKY